VLDVCLTPAAGSCAPTPNSAGRTALIYWRWMRPPEIEAPAAPARHQNQRPAGGSRAHHGHLQGHHHPPRAALGARAAQVARVTILAADAAVFRHLHDHVYDAAALHSIWEARAPRRGRTSEAPQRVTMFVLILCATCKLACKHTEGRQESSIVVHAANARLLLCKSITVFVVT